MYSLKLVVWFPAWTLLLAIVLLPGQSAYAKKKVIKVSTDEVLAAPGIAFTVVATLDEQDAAEKLRAVKDTVENELLRIAYARLKRLDQTAGFKDGLNSCSARSSKGSSDYKECEHNLILRLLEDKVNRRAEERLDQLSDTEVRSLVEGRHPKSIEMIKKMPMAQIRWNAEMDFRDDEKQAMLTAAKKHFEIQFDSDLLQALPEAAKKKMAEIQKKWDKDANLPNASS
jgi:hypothetical protein